MPARIIKLPESMKKTHKLVNGELVKLDKPLKSKRKKDDSLLEILIGFVVCLGLAIAGSNDVVRRWESEDRSCQFYVDKGMMHKFEDECSLTHKIDWDRKVTRK